MKSFINLRDSCSRELPEKLRGEDERFADGLVEALLHEYTRRGDSVIDSFAGFGTTLVVAERMGRIGYGLKIDSHRLEYAKSQLTHRENIVHGDARLVAQYGFAAMDSVD